MAAQIVRPKLNSEAKEIRVIELQPGNYNGPIVVKSITTSLLDSIPFEPLSYAWGDPNVTMPIEMDGSTYPVTVYLYSALRNLRKPSEVRLMWVDSISINQRDDEEKSQQVNLMRDIYASANTCVVCSETF
ncbi:Heterokaryon incompatibility protein 6,OR allele [Lachnellula subtilissima]|uniref:Heterokaryon incompatibility protein 6,OR allele n=1 Tax=Lachnellula subtilissima TaxID=602034 RepID=A0A8H8UDM2_9HELO|nr:Heterokaryon incompatibility protein 6,OR allele [Lachnellula subtilissima]